MYTEGAHRHTHAHTHTRTHGECREYKRDILPTQQTSALLSLTHSSNTLNLSSQDDCRAVCVCRAGSPMYELFGAPFSSPPMDEGQRSISSPSEVALLDSDIHNLGELQPRHSRSASQLKALPLAEEDADSRANLSELLARLISSRKGSVRRNSTANSRGNANHRIADRDYLGWMDFGRRSAEEYEYSSQSLTLPGSYVVTLMASSSPHYSGGPGAFIAILAPTMAG
ncbi:hypothetical protein INR49_023736 [Caranx melampygus]|nr:hypothetical protein INR49_023736 [Caranx melampygus]